MRPLIEAIPVVNKLRALQNDIAHDTLKKSVPHDRYLHLTGVYKGLQDAIALIEQAGREEDED